jgi:hypothetical protein
MTIVLETRDSAFLIGSAHLAQRGERFDLAADWDIDQSNPFITWIAGDFVEGDNPNSNGQFWTAGDLEMAEYTIKYAPLNMVHKFRQPVGFFAATRTVSLDRADTGGSMKIQALSGLWSHIFPYETSQVEEANADGLLYYSMECRGTHLRCAGARGCGKTFEYSKVDTHCDHLRDRASIRHIVNPTFRGGALIVPPVKPGWKNASASVIRDGVMEEAARYAEQTQDQFAAFDASNELTATGWEQLMAMVLMTRT